MNVMKGVLRPQRVQPKKSPLSLERIEISNLISQLKAKKEHSSNLSILNESNILDDMDEKLTD